jgi:predicted TIM-barrel fold metal-dependent hydrolase
MNDAHCHFFSEQFFATLGRQRAPLAPQSAADIVAALKWDPPGSPDDLADRWVDALDRGGVRRASLIASVPGDEESVARALARHPSRFVGFFMLDPTAPDAAARTEHALGQFGLRAICLFPAMQRYPLQDARVREIVQLAAAHAGTAVFVHCGALSVGVRKKLGLPSRFDVRYGNPLDLHALAADFPDVPFIIPHFGAGLFREALLVADLCANVYLDTSSTNRWMAYHPALTLADVFRQALAVTGPNRLLFGTDSSFFPRGWNREVYQAQAGALEIAGVDAAVRECIFGTNFDRLFPA